MTSSSGIPNPVSTGSASSIASIVFAVLLGACLPAAARGQEPSVPATGAGSQAPASRPSVSPVRFEGAADPTGALVQRIDLSLPPFHGLEPRLAAAYHSRLGDGPLGVGWSLAGLSAVQLASAGKGIASFDGASDVYLLDGELLHICLTGSPSPSCRHPVTTGSYDNYSTHVERYKRIGRDTATGAWAVWLQNGTRLDYTERTRTAGGTAAAWLLTTATDTSGNQVRYLYTPEAPGAARLLAGIRYGSTEIDLHYTRRSDPVTYGIGGGTVVADDRRLATVDVQTAGSRLRAYAFEYTASQTTGRSLLAEVQEFGRDARLDSSGAVDRGASRSFLPPTRLSYRSDPDGADPLEVRAEPFDPAEGSTAGFAQDRGAASLTVRREALTGNALRHLTVDLNGDGLTDHVLVIVDPNAKTGDTTGAYPVTFQAYLTRPGGALKRLAPFTYPIVNPGDPYLQVQLADVDGDRRPEIVVFPAFTLPVPHFETVTLFFDAANEAFTRAVEDRELAGVSFFVRFALSVDARDLPIDHAIAWGVQIFAGDLNGDGFADLVLANPQGPDRLYTLHVAIGQGDGTFSPIAPLNTAQQASVDARWLLGELNGDGRSDLVFVGPDFDDGHPTAPAAAEGSHLVVCGALSSAAFDPFFRNTPFVIKCQLTAIPALQREDRCKISVPRFPTPIPSYFQAGRDGFVMADVNADGARDLVRIGADLDIATCNARPFPRDSTYQAYQYLLSHGDGSFAVMSEYTPRLAKGTFVLVADIEGDRRDDLLALRPVVEGTPCIPSPPGTDCGPQATVIQVRNKGVRGTVEVAPEAREATPGLAFPYGGFYFGRLYLTYSFDTLETGDFDGDGRAEISIWHRRHDKDGFLDEIGWFDEARTRLCTAPVCPFYNVQLGVRTWQPGAEPIDAARWKTADVDGDGDPDYVKVEISGGVERPSQLSLYVRLRRPDGTFQPLPRATFSAPPGFSPDALQIADVDADGRADLVGTRYEEPVAPGRQPRLWVLTLRAEGDGLFTASQWLQEVQRRMPETAHWYTADTDGDGRADLVHIASVPSGQHGCRWQLRLDVFRWSGAFEIDPVTGARRAVSVWTPEPATFLPTCAAGRNSPDWYVYDVDRNGTHDFVGAWPRPTRPVITYGVVTLLAGRDGSFRAVEATAASNYNHAPSRWTPIDLNGDGLPELAAGVHNILGRTAELRVHVLLSSGDGGVTLTRAYHEFGLAVSQTRDLAFLEWNGDGRTDLMRLWFEPGGSRAGFTAVPLVSDGRSLTAAPRVRVASALPYPDAVHLRALTVDGGQRQALEYLGTGWPLPEMLVHTTSWYPAPRLVADLLWKVDQPFGAQTSVDYVAMIRASRTSEPPGGCQLPPRPGYLVSKVTLEPRGDAVSETIGYACPRYSPAERSLWAWQEIVRTEAPPAHRPARTTVETWGTDDQCGARLLATLVTGGGRRRQVSRTVRPPNPQPPYRCETMEVAATDTDASGTRTLAAAFLYNDLGGVTEHRELGDTARTGDERTTHTTYEIASGPFIVTPALRTVHAGVGTAGAMLSQSESCYDGALCSHRALDRGLLTAERRFHDLGGGFVTVRRLGYDARGNVTAITDANGATTAIAYDRTFALYPESLQNAAGHVTTLEWDFVLGQPTALIDPNRVQQEERRYDALGRVVAITTPDGGTTAFDYLSWGLPAQGVRTAVADGSPSGLWSEVRFDGLGRTTEVRRKVSEAGPAWVFSLRYGDLSDNPRELTHGAFEGTVGVPVETFTYDFLDQLAAIAHPDGSAAKTATLALGASETDELGHQREVAHDAYGNVTSLTESGARTMTFTHDLLGRLTRVADARDNTIALQWDSLGRLVREQDPDLGDRTFTYDAAGNLTGVRDAESNDIALTYDTLGRPVHRTVNGTPTVTWTYDEPGHGRGLGRLTTVLDTRSGCATARSLDYDRRGRITSETRCWDGTSYTLGSTFDPLGRLASLTYPSAANRKPADGERLVPTYQANGFPNALPGLVTATVHDPQGRLLARDFANGSRASYTYDPQREWPQSDVFTLPAAVVHALTYRMSSDASLVGVSAVSPTRRVDSSFALDGQHRLVHAEQTVLGTTTSETFAYDDVGNLTAAGGDVYIYPPYGPTSRLVHAAQKIGNRTFAYDAAGNTTAVEKSGRDEQRFEWDGEGQLTAAEVWDGAAWQRTEYAYDADGRRIKVRTPDGRVAYELFDEVEQDRAGRLVKSYYAGGERVARRDGAGALRYFHSDLLGSVRLVSNETGAAVDAFEFSAFGRVEKGDVGQAGGYGFTGAHHDLSTALPGEAGSGLLSLDARAYDPVSRRFVSPDSVVPTLGASQGLLRYAYAFHSPAQFVDPSGHSPEQVVSPGPGGGFGGGPGAGLRQGLLPGEGGARWAGLRALGAGTHPGMKPGVFTPALPIMLNAWAAGMAAAVVGLAGGEVAYGAYLGLNELALQGLVYIQVADPEILPAVLFAFFGMTSPATLPAAIQSPRQPGPPVARSNPARITPGSLPAEEEQALLNTLHAIERFRQTSNRPGGRLGKQFGLPFENRGGYLPGVPGQGGYKEFWVAPRPGSAKNENVRRIVVSDDFLRYYYSWTHYGFRDLLPAFVIIR